MTDSRKTKRSIGLSALICVATVALPASADVFDMGPGLTDLEFIVVGNPGNLPDPDIWEGLTPPDIGAVDYEYRIGKYEVTNAQYAEFLNAVDGDGFNPNGIYNLEMATNFGGIDYFPDNPAGDKYVARAGRENNPVSYVSWYDAARFANWLHNGQGAGDTESGVYTLTGPTQIDGGRSAEATYFIASENEWYKAAYHQPAAAGGDADDYWLYPTGRNSAPGNDIPTGANYFDDSGFVATGSGEFPETVSPFTDVGAFFDAPSYYGTFDQGGNVSEWNEDVGVYSTKRVLRGGSWGWTPGLLETYARASASPLHEDSSVGFRIAATLEPTQALRHGDLNCDGYVNFGDIDPFVMALNGHNTYAAHFPDCNWHHGDCNQDGHVNFRDIDAFVAILNGN